MREYICFTVNPCWSLCRRCGSGLHWATATSPNCRECWLYNENYPPLFLPEKIPSSQSGNPRSITLAETRPLIQGENDLMLQLYYPEPLSCTSDHGQTIWDPILAQFLLFPHPLLLLSLQIYLQAFSINHNDKIPVSGSASMEPNLKQLHKHRSTQNAESEHLVYILTESHKCILLHRTVRIQASTSQSGAPLPQPDLQLFFSVCTSQRDIHIPTMIHL